MLLACYRVWVLIMIYWFELSWNSCDCTEKYKFEHFLVILLLIKVRELSHLYTVELAHRLDVDDSSEVVAPFLVKCDDVSYVKAR